MGSESNIQWCDATWNIARGCTKVNEDCLHCYMMRDGEKYGYDGKAVKRTKTVFDLPDRLKEPGTKVFMSSLTDWAHPAIDEYREDAYAIMRRNQHLLYLMLTKRWERIPAVLPFDWGAGWPNVWMGISAGSQRRYDEAMEHFRHVKAKIKWVSLEPLTAPIDNLNLKENGISWVVVGGESGNDKGKWGYRPCDGQWILNIVRECQAAGVPVFVKQLGTWLSRELKLKDRHGGDISEWWGWLRVREFPKG